MISRENKAAKRATYIDIYASEDVHLGSKRVRKVHITDVHRMARFRTVSTVFICFPYRRLKVLKPKDIVGRIDAFSDAGRILEKLGSRLAREEDA